VITSGIGTFRRADSSLIYDDQPLLRTVEQVSNYSKYIEVGYASTAQKPVHGAAYRPTEWICAYPMCSGIVISHYPHDTMKRQWWMFCDVHALLYRHVTVIG
jgi:hypothetical protein